MVCSENLMSTEDVPQDKLVSLRSSALWEMAKDLLKYVHVQLNA